MDGDWRRLRDGASGCQHPRRRRGRRRSAEGGGGRLPSAANVEVPAPAHSGGPPLPLVERRPPPRSPRRHRRCGGCDEDGDDESGWKRPARRRAAAISALIFPALLLAAAAGWVLPPSATRTTAEAAANPSSPPARDGRNGGGGGAEAEAPADQLNDPVAETANEGDSVGGGASAASTTTEAEAVAATEAASTATATAGTPPPRSIHGAELAGPAGVGRAPASPPPPSTTPAVPREAEEDAAETAVVARPAELSGEEEQEEEDRLRRRRKLEMDDFADWCRQVMGIETSLEIRYFDYPAEFLRERDAFDEEEDDDFFGHEDAASAAAAADERRPEMVKVRGLAAARDIAAGDVVISIPLNAMVTLKTTVDHDPVLSRVLGPESRAAYGWDGPDDAADYEIPILIAAVLYHRSLGRRSPLASYVKVLETAPVDSMPFLWDRGRLRTEAGEGVRRAVRDVRADIRDMYDAVIEVLVRDYPEVFGRKKGGGDSSSTADGGYDDDDWVFSYKNFQWAFAMVNSRHWHVPVADLDDDRDDAAAPPPPRTKKKERPTMDIDGSDRPPTKVLSSVASEMPPAEQPTDEYVQRQEGLVLSSAATLAGDGDGDPDAAAKEARNEVDDDAASDEEAEDDDTWRPPRRPGGVRRHSFLAPLADLLNFGPPCTRGVYDPVAHRFDIVATCPYRPGQEVTFFYSDDCSDLIFANYGFVHPLVPPCPTADEHRASADAWRDYAERLEGALDETYREVDRLEGEADELRSRMRDCGGCGGGGNGGGDPGATPPEGADDEGGAAAVRPPPMAQRQEQDLDRSAPPAPPRRTLRTERGIDVADRADGIRGGAGEGESGDDRRKNKPDHPPDEGHGGIRRMWMRPKSDRGL